MAEVIDLEKLQNSFQEANQADTPIAVSTPSGSHIIGDTTKQGTTTPQDYTLEFWLPVVNGQYPEGAKLERDGEVYVQEVVAKQKFITQRAGRKVRNYASTIAVAFVDFKEEGFSEIYTADDLLKVYQLFTDDVVEACEKLVCEVLGVSENLIPYITDRSLFGTVGKIMTNNPGFFQASDLFD